MNSKSLLASAIGLALLGSINVAEAAAVATSGIQVSNFLIHQGSTAGSPTLDNASLSSLQYTSSGSTSATLNGATSGSGTVVTTNAATGIDLFSSQGAANPAHTANVFNSQAYSSAFGNPLPGSSFAFGDQFESGSPITGLAGASTPANLYNQSTASIDGTGVGGATSNNGLVADWQFVLGFSDFLTFTFDVSAYLESYVTNNSIAPTSAQSGGSIQFLLTDLTDLTATNLLTGNTSFTWNTGRNAPLGNGSPSVAGIFSGLGTPILNVSQTATTSAALIAGRTYNLTANIFTSANVQSVPEPGMLALMGLGMLGMASMRNRRVS